MTAADTTIITERLQLVPYAPAHLDGLYAMNSDPEVMRHLGPPQTREEVATSIARQQHVWARNGFGWWSVIEREAEALVGAACLQHLAHVETNPLEIGWRLRPAGQGKGYATEAGRAVMRYGFDVIGESRLVAVTDPENKASARVMERLGMTYIGIQTHYDVPCVTYEIKRTDR
ncbi:GNAT family N-acetyltransferase [Loktanella sp. Alg231-35]|uniref:GNAT family N-acetyltransferase n=1 Tax=Loktanella sp. Alg231-35 TaxID=1922220 RepID=UPI000D55C537|nr:GNAT family N-acetyltransferase [Loktanella sp. Alg231-35]